MTIAISDVRERLLAEEKPASAQFQKLGLLALTLPIGLAAVPTDLWGDCSYSSILWHASVEPTPDLFAGRISVLLEEAPSSHSSDVRPDRDEVLWVKEHSGLTWDQLGKVFGVSRRAVHLWANGGRMNESNSRTLRDFAAEVRRLLQDAPDSTRAALLARTAEGASTVDQFRMRHAVPSGESWGAPFAAEEKVEVQHTRLDQQT